MKAQAVESGAIVEAPEKPAVAPYKTTTTTTKKRF